MSVWAKPGDDWTLSAAGATSRDEQSGRGVQWDERLQQPGGGQGGQQEEPPLHQAGQASPEAGEQQQRETADARTQRRIPGEFLEFPGNV